MSDKGYGFSIFYDDGWRCDLTLEDGEYSPERIAEIVSQRKQIQEFLQEREVVIVDGEERRYEWRKEST